MVYVIIIILFIVIKLIVNNLASKEDKLLNPDILIKNNTNISAEARFMKSKVIIDEVLSGTNIRTSTYKIVDNVDANLQWKLVDEYLSLEDVYTGPIQKVVAGIISSEVDEKELLIYKDLIKPHTPPMYIFQDLAVKYELFKSSKIVKMNKKFK